MSNEPPEGIVDRATLARWLAVAAWPAYSNSLTGNAPPALRAYYDRATNPRPGDMVAEITTIGWGGGDPLACVGTLLEARQEPVPDWDEATDGPAPTEEVFVLRTLDGAEFRWKNARFIVVPTNVGFPKDPSGWRPGC